MHARSLQPLTLVFRPWLVTVFAGAMGLGSLIVGIVRTVRGGVGWDNTWGALLAACLGLGIGSFAARFWTVVFDGPAGAVRWRVWTVWGVRRGEIPYDLIVGVSHPVGKSSSGVPPRGIALVLADGASFRLSYYTAVRRGFDRLQRVGALIRREVGIDEPGEELALADAVLAADSDVQAAKAVRELLGVPLSEARVIARGIRRGDSGDAGA